MAGKYIPMPTSSRRKARKEMRVSVGVAPGLAVTQHTAMDTDIIISTVFRMQASLQPDCCIVIKPRPTYLLV